MEGPKATYTVGKSTRSEKHMQHTINKTQRNRKKKYRNQALHIKPHEKKSSTTHKNHIKN